VTVEDDTRMSRRHRLLLAVVAVLLAVLAAAVGWGLPVLITSDRHPQAAETNHSLTSEQAQQQACNAFRVASRQWEQAYSEWLPAISGPRWQWGDRAVRAATARFTEIESEIVAQLDSLIPTNTPTEVAEAIRSYTAALLEYSAGHGAASQREMDGQEDEIDDAAEGVSAVCG
jgi:hypothetical protein